MNVRSTCKRIAFAVATLALALTSACQRDEVDNSAPSNRIMLRIVEDRPASTRASESGQKIPFELNGRTLQLSFDVQEAASDDQTRAAGLDNDSNPITQITVAALRSNGALYFRDAEVAITDQKGISSRFWPDEALSFYAYSSSDPDLSLTPSFVLDGEGCSATFDYALPAAATASPRKDASMQPDLLFAITPDQSLANSSEVQLTFHHALSAILFKVGTMPDGVQLKSITLAGVYGEGLCEVTDLGEQELQFAWSYAGKNQTAAYTEEFEQEAEKGELMGSAESIFMMLPQTMSNTTRLRLGFTLDGVDYTFEKSFKEIITAWEPDKKYIFTLGLPDEIDVEIDDRVEGNVKSEVKITNPGVVTGYVRAAIVGYWCSAVGEVAGPWSPSDGEFVYAADWGAYWRQGADGFYYYLLPLEHGKETERPLFESYTLSEAASSAHVGQSLEINLAVQIIPITQKSLWSELDDVTNP